MGKRKRGEGGEGRKRGRMEGIRKEIGVRKDMIDREGERTN